MNIAVVLASGFGTRMKAQKNKILLSLDRKPVIVHTIMNFVRSPLIGKIILVVREEEKEIFRDLVSRHKMHKVSAYVTGGTQRQYSAYNAVLHCGLSDNDDADILLFHNGANPFVSEEEISAVIDAARVHGAAAVAHPTKDTIKEVDAHGRVVRTLDRSVLWNMQTPQAIQYNIARRAFDQAHKDGHLGTDDVSLVEYINEPVAIVEASEHNFKITTPRDLAVAHMILREKRNLF